MTRRELVAMAAMSGVRAPLVVPVHLIYDNRAKLTPEQMRYFSGALWPEAVRDFERCSIRLDCTTTEGEIRRTPSSKPIFVGLESGVVNLVLTDYIPMDWDRGRGVTGVTTLYEGRHVCVIALAHAHTHRIPLVAVNTCVHELLHAFLHDIFENRPRGLTGAAREFRVDWLATRLWLYHEGTMIRRAAEAYVQRLRSKEIGRRAQASAAGKV
jgi:hypothetical protein